VRRKKRKKTYLSNKIINLFLDKNKKMNFSWDNLNGFRKEENI